MGCSSSKDSASRPGPSTLDNVGNARSHQVSTVVSPRLDHDPINSAIVQICKDTLEGFQQRKDIKEIDQAMESINSRFADFTQRGRARPQASGSVATLYTARFTESQDADDLHIALLYWGTAFASIPPTNPAQGTYLLRYIGQLQGLSKDDERVSLGVLNSYISTVEVLFTRMSRNYRERHDCYVLYGDVLRRMYTRSRSLPDLCRLVNVVELVYHDVNIEAASNGMRHIDTSAIAELQGITESLSRAPLGPAKHAGEQRVYDALVKIWESSETFHGVRSMDKETIILLDIYARAAERAELVSEVDAQRRAQGAEHRTLQLKKRASQPPPGTEPDFKPLDVDPTNGLIMLDVSGYMNTIFGGGFCKSFPEEEFAKRMLQLENESVAAAEAKGQHPNPKLCRMCRHVLPLGPSEDKIGFKWLMKNWLIPFGNWNQLRLRRHCVICRLIISLLATESSGDTLHPQLAAIDDTVQGTTLRLEQVLATKEIVLRVEYGHKEVGSLRLVTEANATTALRQGWETEGEGSSPRSASVKSKQQINISQLKDWLINCEKRHGHACHPGPRKEEAVPIILIDVVNNCLVSTTSAVRYFALSYVWGTVDTSPTLVANYVSRCEPRGLETSQRFPATIADAMLLISSFEERYLWVDALCIVQDDTEQKMRDIAHMDRIYSHAHATIVALHGADANAGLPGLRPSSRQSQLVETLKIDRGSKDLDYNPCPHIAEGEDPSVSKITLDIVATPPSLHLAIELQRWSTRGWTFQEQLLSRRCLYFAENYVYFHCSNGKDEVRSESGINGSVWPVQEWEQMEKQFGNPKTPLVTSLDNPLVRLKSQESTPKPLGDAFSVYASLVGKYTKRNMSHPEDIINAFTGTLAVLNKSLSSPILCALPAVMLDLALLWTPAGKLTRRGGRDIQAQARSELAKGTPLEGRALRTGWGTTELVLGPSGLTTFDEGVDRRFPSWSWAGWQGDVEYRTFETTVPEEGLPRPLIQDVAVNLDGKELRCIGGRAQPRTNVSSTNKTQTPPPTLPNVLHFLAPVLPLSAFKLSENRKYISVSNRTHTASHQSVRRILDHAGRHCGLWWEQAGYKYVGRGVNVEAEAMMRLVGVSVHDDTSESRKGPSVVEESEPWFDAAVYPPTGKGSGLMNVLAIDDDVGHEYAERMTIARIHVQAWEEAGPTERMVRLA